MSQPADSNATGAINSSPAWLALEAHAASAAIAGPQAHLRSLLQDGARAQALQAEYDGILLDYSRQRVTQDTVNLLFDLAEAANVRGKVQQLRDGAHVNATEDRAAMHIALRSAENEVYKVDGENVVPAVHAVLKQIREFSDAVRSGAWTGATGKKLTNVVAIGIGGSYLGANFVYEALHSDAESSKAAAGRQLRFLANVDPVGSARALEGLDPATTLAIVISKTFTTRETILNARTVRDWLKKGLGNGADVVAKHMVAVSTNLKEVESFGIDAKKGTFAFWDWVGGRYSVTSAVGLLPLALHYSYGTVDRFLAGCRSLDHHFLTAEPRANLPYLLGLLGVWNTNFLGFKSRALACYSEAMLKLAPHIQQVDMESNGKRVTTDGKVATFTTGEVNFGEPGTNAQHSFFQLFHQGQVVPVDFVGFCSSQHPVNLPEYEVSNHDELMANFFAQPDALAQGKTAEELTAEGVAASLVPHRVMPGNRPSNVLLLPRLTAYEVGQLLALYEHRTVVQGFVYSINSFDQWGVELGKKLADQVRKQMVLSRSKDGKAAIDKQFNPSTQALLNRYFTAKL